MLKCTICLIRPQMTLAQHREEGASRDMTYCWPCWTEAGWENTHSDNGHEDANDGEPEIKDCWICNPKLNQAAKDYTPRNGSSRKGIIMIVPIRATGQEKAKVVASRLGTSHKTTITTRKGVVTLKTDGLILRWDVDGHYLYAQSSATVDGKARKVRNVSEALRLVA